MENVVTISDLTRDDVGCVLSCRAINNNISSPVETTVHLDVICELQYTHTRVVRPVTCRRKSKVSVFVIRYVRCILAWSLSNSKADLVTIMINV